MCSSLPSVNLTFLTNILCSYMLFVREKNAFSGAISFSKLFQMHFNHKSMPVNQIFEQQKFNTECKWRRQVKCFLKNSSEWTWYLYDRIQVRFKHINTRFRVNRMYILFLVRVQNLHRWNCIRGAACEHLWKDVLNISRIHQGKPRKL